MEDQEVPATPEASAIISPVSQVVEPTATEADIEAEIQGKGLTAPRLTPDAIDAQIVAEQYHVFPGTTVTACCLTLRNGFNTVGKSACASPENFNEDIGRKVARAAAREEIWALEGYRLKQFLYGQATG